MRKARIALTAALVTTLGLGLTACGGGSEDGATEKESPAASTPASAKESPSADGGENEGGDTEPAGDVAAPGSELKVGDKAVLPFEYAKKKGTLAITVTAIDKGAEADLSQFGARAKGLTPYFIKMKVENVGDADLSRAYVQLRGLLDGGQSTGVSLIGDIPGKCDKESAPAEFAKGASFETCSLAASRSGDVTGAEFDEGDAYSDKPVVWTAG
ncbi:hypothetical protein [Streptomyces cavernicola]|uniref:DUF4352 domain-containing protein n=1 Tax=Streptomyces cavernicola TaxID=3043613 RepID=A0ABT6SBS2_9ACTN|nr:hypothetical protein [Streptomyces sp. B-S-A6]MDI3405647.1 hypothetical protein [Streptomyces sp. B-S-A6]